MYGHTRCHVSTYAGLVAHRGTMAKPLTQALFISLSVSFSVCDRNTIADML